ncbi:ATP-dependent RecD-like DNA helicase [Geomonas sp. Red69]|uniref:AAA family ATPase n=1 Tax=Geomonas diazotrophica TaxID=2843197 RepID=UPI001C12668B|nr:AAA family ATPase [Geomonas diazotrophica]MBU5637510.1 ATP-dependent RecD-like DNA helicase [Geomonas diazotrophica]
MHTVVISNVISQNAYGIIASCRCKNDNPINVILPPNLAPVTGEVYEIEGEKTEFKDRYGRSVPQIKATSAVRARTSGRLIRPWLESLPGIGPTRSKRLLSTFGEDVVWCLSNVEMTQQLARALEPDKPVVGERLAALVQMHYFARQAQESLAVLEGEFLLYLESCGITDRLAAKKMFRLIGDLNALEQLKLKPYLAASLLPWKQADHLGRNLLRQIEGAAHATRHPDRLVGACDNVWRECLKNGNTAMTKADFLHELHRRDVIPALALQAGVDRGNIRVAGDLLRAPGAAYLEATLAARIVDFEQVDERPFDIPENLDALVRSNEDPNRPLTAEQRRAVCSILSSKLSILQGGAGTGKTTTLKVLVNVWISLGGNVLLGALSGKAALRMSSSTGRRAQTLARHLLELEQAQGGGDSGTLPLFPGVDTKTLFIVDEASMVDIVTFRKVMNCLPDGASLVLVGDTAQLPPVGLGQVYFDLVQLGAKTYHLNQVHRQSQENPIIKTATMIRQGIAPALPTWEDTTAPGAFHLKVPSAGIEAAVIRLLEDKLTKVPIDEILVLAALKRTCRNINRAMQVRKNVNGITGVRISPFAPWVSEGDPVICTRNRYKDGLMNGMLGHVASLEPFTIRWQGEVSAKMVPKEAWVDIASAWALTCHKAQGSECKYVIVALDGNEMLTLEWLYTALTRATEQVVLIGPSTALETVVGRRSTRTTCFREEVALRRKQKRTPNL